MSDAIVSSHDRDLMRRIGVVLAFVILFTASASQLYWMYAKKFFDVTGPAKWIWAQHQISQQTPVVFYAVRDFDLPPNRPFTRIKIAAEPEYAMYFNGALVAHRKMGAKQWLDEHDVSKLARDGPNRLVIAVRSASGVGGLLAGIDIAPELENFVATGRDWKIYRRWSSDLPLRNPSQPAEAPMLLGEPPTGRWDYLPLKPGEPFAQLRTVVQPVSATPFIAQVQTSRIEMGVQVVGTIATRAVAYDFGGTIGHLRLTLNGRQAVPPLVRVRFANAPEELKLVETEMIPYAFGEGETTVIDPDVRGFRYAIVYGGRATADVLR